MLQFMYCKVLHLPDKLHLDNNDSEQLTLFCMYSFSYGKPMSYNSLLFYYHECETWYPALRLEYT